MTAMGLVMTALGVALVWSGVRGQSIADVIASVTRGEKVGLSVAAAEESAQAGGREWKPNYVRSEPMPAGWVPGQDTGNIVQ